MVRSDNELGFQKLGRILRDVHSKFRKIAPILHREFQHFTWVFTTPYAPRAGGHCERLIRSIKSTLDQVRLYDAITYEELETLFREVQGFMNSRPLIASDPDWVLSPAHLLYGRPIQLFAPVKTAVERKNDLSIIEYS